MRGFKSWIFTWIRVSIYKCFSFFKLLRWTHLSMASRHEIPGVLHFAFSTCVVKWIWLGFSLQCCAFWVPNNAFENYVNKQALQLLWHVSLSALEKIQLFCWSNLPCGLLKYATWMYWKELMKLFHSSQCLVVLHVVFTLQKNLNIKMWPLKNFSK